MEPSDKYLIDVGALFRSKLGEKTPKWLIWLGRKLLHEDFLNTCFKMGYTGVEFAEKALEYMHVTLQVEGLWRKSRQTGWSRWLPTIRSAAMTPWR